MTIAHPRPGVAARPAPLSTSYATVRQASLGLAAPLSPEDCQLQSMPDASPTKWHLAHTTWFFETFVLERFEPGFRPFDAAYRVLFNSYYQAVGGATPAAAARPAQPADAGRGAAPTAPTSMRACRR